MYGSFVVFKRLLTLLCFFALLLLIYYFIEIPTSKRFFLTVKGAMLEVEIADNSYLRQKGLMGRQHLPENQGVLFIFPFEAIQRFWMKNTIIPLSIAFIQKECRISQIVQMEPDRWNGKLPEYQSHEKVRLALEVNQGWFEKQGVGPGDKIYFSRSVEKRVAAVRE